MQAILKYLKDTYQPETIIVYGSYADCSANQNSDFDAFLISGCLQTIHDTGMVNGIILDVFVYPNSTPFAVEDITRLYFGKILLDQNGRGKDLMEQVSRFIQQYPMKTNAEIAEELAWCDKMLARAQRGDAEGYYRHHWLLCDSLEFYCDIQHRYYFGPKKSLHWMEQEKPEAFACYSRALRTMGLRELAQWVAYLKTQMMLDTHHGDAYNR